MIVGFVRSQNRDVSMRKSRKIYVLPFSQSSVRRNQHFVYLGTELKYLLGYYRLKNEGSDGLFFFMC